MVPKKNRVLKEAQRFGVVVARFNEFITQRLLSGCLEELRRRKVSDKDIVLVWVPGSFELPVAALKLAKKKNIDAVICLGCVIRGETIHFELVAQNAASGIGQVGLESGKPVIFGVLTTNTVKQAYARSKAKGDNKGRDSAAAALDMIEALRGI